VSLCRTYRFRIYPTAKQTARLVTLLAQQCELYNAALEERRGAWRLGRRSVSYVDQCRTLTELRDVEPAIKGGVLLHGLWASSPCRRQRRSERVAGR
jgi:hypothetical protein